MADFTPTTNQVRITYCYTVRKASLREIDMHTAAAEFHRWLATVTPNPDDERQVEVVAREIHRHMEPQELWKNSRRQDAYRRIARAVLAALAEAAP